MKTWQTLLREGDPVGREPSLSTDDVERMRRHVVAAERPDGSWSWSTRFAIGSLAVAVALAGAGVWLDARMRRAPIASAQSDGPAAGAGTASYRRQLQFATPGGTRVIWTFDSNFDKR